MTTLLAVALAVALAVLAAAVTAMLLDSRKITRLERTLAVADRAIEQLTTERDEARRSLRDALDIQRDAYIRVRPTGLTGAPIRPYPQNRASEGVPETFESAPRCPSCGSLGDEPGLRLVTCTDPFHVAEPTRDFTRIVERNNWPKWPDNGGRS